MENDINPVGFIEQLPLPVREVLFILESLGYSAFVVGGAIRDYMLTRPIKDFDIATSGMPDQVAAAFKKVHFTGLKHGTVTVLMDSLAIEVTTFRQDGAYEDGRRPQSVTLGVPLTEDLSRRDFTMNAMAIDLRGHLVDPFGGARHLSEGVIETVGDAATRFSEDKLRKLRALRFMSQLGFDLSPNVLKALAASPELEGVSWERVQIEIDKLLLGRAAPEALKAMQGVGLLGSVFPELLPLVGFHQCHPAHLYDVFEHTLHVVRACPLAVDKMAIVPLSTFWRLALLWSALFHDAGKPMVQTFDGQQGDPNTGPLAHYYGHQDQSAQIFEVAAKRFKQQKRLMQVAKDLIEGHMHRPVTEIKPVRRWIRRLRDHYQAMGLEKIPGGFEAYVSVRLAFMQADAMGTGTYEDQTYHLTLRSLVLEALRAANVFDRHALAINGNDLRDAFPFLGDHPKCMKPLLEHLVAACIEQPESNEANTLLALSELWLTKHLSEMGCY